MITNKTRFERLHRFYIGHYITLHAIGLVRKEFPLAAQTFHMSLLRILMRPRLVEMEVGGEVGRRGPENARFTLKRTERYVRAEFYA